MGFFEGLDAEKFDRQYADRVLAGRMAGYFKPHWRRLVIVVSMSLLLALLGVGFRVVVADGVDQLKYYKEKSKIVNGADTKDVGLTFQGEITVGKFVDRERPTWLDAMNEHYTQHFGEKYVPYGVSHGQD